MIVALWSRSWRSLSSFCGCSGFVTRARLRDRCTRSRIDSRRHVHEHRPFLVLVRAYSVIFALLAASWSASGAPSGTGARSQELEDRVTRPLALADPSCLGRRLSFG